VEQNVLKDIIIISKGTEVLHSCVDLQRVLQASFSDMCLTFFQGGSELMDVKVEEVGYMKEEDPLSVTCPALMPEKEVSCVSVSTVTLIS
jgi:hypothetical protein